jgi:hypothetical protein
VKADAALARVRLEAQAAAASNGRRTSRPTPHRQRNLSTASLAPPIDRTLELSNRCGYSVDPQLRHVGQPPPPGRTVKLLVLPAKSDPSSTVVRGIWCTSLAPGSHRASVVVDGVLRLGVSAVGRRRCHNPAETCRNGACLSRWSSERDPAWEAGPGPVRPMRQLASGGRSRRFESFRAYLARPRS